GLHHRPWCFAKYDALGLESAAWRRSARRPAHSRAERHHRLAARQSKQSKIGQAMTWWPARTVVPTLAIALALTALVRAVPAAPQSPATPAAPSGQKLGDACTRKSDQKGGVVKRDACGRWYCGLAEVKDIIELRPNIASELGCAWQLEG